MSELGELNKRYVLTPWKIALSGSAGGIAFAIPYALLSDVHQISLPGGWSLSTLYFVLFIPSISILWALYGIARRKRDGNLSWCIVSLFLSVSSIGFAVISAMSN